MNGLMLRDLFRSIRKSFMRFASIIVIVALGISFFVGIKSASPDMRKTANEYYITNNLMDIQIDSNIGFTSDEIKKIAGVEGIESVGCARMIDTLIFCNGNGLINTDNGSALVCRAYSLDFEQAEKFASGEEIPADYINRINLVDGRFPENKNECLVDSVAAKNYPELKIGAQINLKGDTFNIDDTVNTEMFTITGTVSTPMYISTERGSTLVGSGVLGTFIYIDPSCFISENYDTVYATVKDKAKYDVYSDEYKEYVNSVGEAVREISQKSIDLRLADVRAQAQKKIDETQKIYKTTEEQGTQKLLEALERINSVEDYIAGGDSKIDDETDSLNANVSAAKARLEQSKQNYEERLEDYRENEQTASSTDSELTGQSQARRIYEEYAKKHEKDKQEIDALKIQLESLEKDRDEKKAELDAAEKAYYEKSKEVEAKEKELNQTKKVIQDLKIRQASWTEESGESIADIKAEIKKNNDLAHEQKEELDALKIEAKELDKARNTAKNDYSKTSEKYTSLKATVTTREKTYANNEKTLHGYEEDIKRLEEGEEALSIFKDRLAEAKEDLEKAKIDITVAQLNVYYENSTGTKKLVAAQADLKAAKARLESANENYDKTEHDVKINLNKAKGDVDKARAFLDELNSSVWKISYQRDLPGQEGYKRSLEDIMALANIFPVIFFVVAALMCLVTMTRMVQEERMQLGTLKALGYGGIRISLKYYHYAAAACIIGAVIGSAAGTTLFPVAINAAYSIMYNLPDVKMSFNWIYIIAGTVFELAVTVIATRIACRRELHTQAALLMRPKAPAPGKKLFLERFVTLWNKLSFGTVVMLRNMFRFKKRMVITIIGIAGCTMLILSALGIRNSLDSVVTSQYSAEGISHYSLIAMTDTLQFPGDSETQQEINKDIRVKESILMSMSALYVDYELDGEEETAQVQLQVPENAEKFASFVTLRTRSGHKKISLDDSGAVVSEKLAKDAGIKPGDELTVYTADGDEYTLKISAVTENYLNHYIYVSPVYYESVFTKAPEYKYISITLKDYANSVDGQNLANDLLQYNYISGIASTDTSVRSFIGVIDRLDSIIAIFIVSAGLLALVTLYNLTNISVQERIREISTVKVLGFTNVETTIYVYAENIFHTLTGILFGFAGGIIIHRVVINIAEVNIVMFGRHIYWWSFLAAAILTAVFSFAASVIVHLNLRNTDVLSSFKSVE